MKRGGGRQQVAFDFNRVDSGAANEPTTTLTAEQIYDRDWALTLLQCIMDRLRQEKLDRLVALKTIRADTATDAAFAERFNREARTLARMSHPNIVGVHDFGEVITE